MIIWSIISILILIVMLNIDLIFLKARSQVKGKSVYIEERHLFPPTKKKTKKFIYYVVIFISMICGMILKSIFDIIDQSEGFTFGALFEKNLFLVRALIVSPIVFAIIIKSINYSNLNIFSILFAIENGFFWQSLLK